MGLLPLVVAGCAGGNRDQPERSPKSPDAISFDDRAVGSVPPGWRIGGTRQGQGPLAEWRVIADPTAPTPPNALALTASGHGQDQTYNLCWTDSIRFGDGRISVRFKSVAGEVDQGGGPIWRVRDADNYYICRANPLESNFRVYKVVDGTRKQLATASVEVASGGWHTIEIEHIGHHIVCTLNGTTRIEATDSALPEAGGVGLWTKADAVTSFDNLRVIPTGN